MDSTFITIHSLDPDGKILFASDSIVDILGYHPQQVLGRSCFDYFHPEEVPLARYIHERGIRMDKAASLHYARIQTVDGRWVGCECCFTVVHDVLVACTSVYRQSQKSQQRAANAPTVRRLFSSPQDPRFHMLEHLAAKFKMTPPLKEREPRAALIINRFSRSLAIMFATESVANILGLDATQLQNKSFYDLVGDECMADAEACLEGAKANDSIAYLRFWSRDARTAEDLEPQESERGTQEPSVDPSEELGPSDMGMTDEHSSPRRNSSDSEQGGVRLDAGMDVDTPGNSASPLKRNPESMGRDGASLAQNSSGSAQTTSGSASEAGGPSATQTAAQADGNNHDETGQTRRNAQPAYPVPSVELEAVVSCTSDGLVVVLRRARPLAQSSYPESSHQIPQSSGQGIFAAPWALDPVRPRYQTGTAYSFAEPNAAPHVPIVQHGAGNPTGPSMDSLMSSIRDVAVFAWGLVGINNNLTQHAHGTANNEARPPQNAFSDEQAPDRGVYAPNGYTQDGTPYWPLPSMTQQPGVSQYNHHGYSDKGIPVEPRYTPYDEQNVNQVRQNGPWSNNGNHSNGNAHSVSGYGNGHGNGNDHLSSVGSSWGQQPPSNGHSYQGQ